MYPGTKFILRDDSVITPIIANSDAKNKPMYMSMFTSDRGPEKFTILEGEKWATTYLSNNTPNFTKHGQPLLQAALGVNAGAKMFSKRLVADNAKLGNKTLMLGLSTIQYAKIGYEKTNLPKGQGGALEVRSTTHIVAADEIDIAKIDDTYTTGATLGKVVKPITLYLAADATTPGRIKIINTEKSTPSGPTFILDNETEIAHAVTTGLVEPDATSPTIAAAGTIVYPYSCLTVSDTTASGYTEVTADNLLYFQSQAVLTYEGAQATTAITVGKFVKNASTYISQAKATAIGYDTTAITGYAVESHVAEEDASNLFLATVTTFNTTTAVADLTATEKATIVNATGHTFAVGDYCVRKPIYYVCDDDRSANGYTVVEAIHVIGTNEIDIKSVTGVKVQEYDRVIRVSTTERGLVLRPMTISTENTDVFYQGVTSDKEYLYGYAKKDIEEIVLDPDTFTNKIIITNPDSIGGAATYRLFNDPAAQASDGILFPLFTIFESGRGVSDKYFSIEPNYSLAKSNGKMIYTLKVIDGSTSATVESWTMSIDANGTSSTLKKTDIQTVVSGNSYLIDATCYYSAWDELSDALADFGAPSSVFSSYDIMNKKLLSGKALTRVEFTSPTTGQSYVLATPRTASNPTGYAASAFDYDYTVPEYLDNGAYGDLVSLADNTDEFYDAMHEALTGVFSKDIYNFDLYAWDCIFDANYDSAQVKLDLQNIAAYRNDCVAFMDMGTKVSSLQQCKDMMAWDGTIAGKSELETDPAYYYLKHNAVWVTDLFYDMKNPFDGRQITVTGTLGASLRMVNHYINGYNRPFAGKMYQIEFPEAIEGTVNYIPKIYPNTTFTPEELENTYPSDAACITNEKQEMNDIKVNYATYLNGVLTMETLFTTYDKDSELSYVNNVMTVQVIMKKIREKLPAITRYGFMDSDSLAQYKTDVQDKVIDQYAHDFASISFKYIEDAEYAKNKIFYGALEVKFKPFSQSEIIKVTVLNNDAI